MLRGHSLWAQLHWHGVIWEDSYSIVETLMKRKEALEEKGQVFHAPNSHVGGGGS